MAVVLQCHPILGFSSRWSINYARLAFIVPSLGLGVRTVHPCVAGMAAAVLLAPSHPGHPPHHGKMGPRSCSYLKKGSKGKE